MNQTQQGDNNSGMLLGRDNVSGYKRDGTSCSRHIDEKNRDGNRTAIWIGGFGFFELALFLQAFDSAHTLMVWCGPE